MDRPKSTVVITEFAGLVSNRGRFPVANPSEALVQTNLRSVRSGQLESRLGFRTITYGTPALGNSADLISVFYYDGATPKIIAEDEGGVIWYGASPT